MGTEPWWYIVPYRPNIAEALAELQQREFKAGRYNPVTSYPFGSGELTAAAPGRSHNSIDAALRASGADGTRSILDIRRAATDPDDIGDGVVTPLPEDFLEERYGTAHPTREMVDLLDVLGEDVGRGQGIYLVLYEGDHPSEVLFAGYSYD
jgi:hypothetical protein